MFVRPRDNAYPPAPSRARESILCKLRDLGHADQVRRLKHQATPRTTRADGDCAEPQGQAVFGDSGVSAAFSMHETHVDQRGLGRLAMEPAPADALVWANDVAHLDVRGGRDGGTSTRAGRVPGSGHVDR
ncbi:hypothetical protein HPB50_028694 [Hyalomma asiaticum]|nr:hypothetical protein HPB50_028694 [Hyalomma asiaticum]